MTDNGTLRALESLGKNPDPPTRKSKRLTEDDVRRIAREEMKLILDLPGIAAAIERAKAKVKRGIKR